MNLTKYQQEKIRRKFKLSNREIDVLNLLFSGVEAIKEISSRMNINERTCKGYLQRIYLKTGKRKKLSAVLKCLEILDLH